MRVAKQVLRPGPNPLVVIGVFLRCTPTVSRSSSATDPPGTGHTAKYTVTGGRSTAACKTPLVKRIVPAAIGMATLSLFVVGCSGERGVQQAQGVTAMVAGSSPGAAMDALISGTLRITDAGCFAVSSGGVTYPLQFPFGTRLSDDGTEVAVPGLASLRAGDELSGGGGYLNLMDVPSVCIADNEYDEYAVWQTVGR